MMRFFSPRFAPLAEPRPDPWRSMFGLGQATAEYGFRGRAIGHYIRPEADMPRTYLAEPRPDPWRGLRGLGGLDFSTISTIVVVGAVALFGGYMLLLWKDARKPYVLRRNPRRRRGKAVLQKNPGNPIVARGLYRPDKEKKSDYYWTLEKESGHYSARIEGPHRRWRLRVPQNKREARAAIMSDIRDVEMRRYSSPYDRRA